MSVRRVMGTEVEYGISVPGDPTANPVITSTQATLWHALRLAGIDDPIAGYGTLLERH